jgi:hypothetical protein
MVKDSRKLGIVYSAGCVMLLLSCLLAVVAQSGRRVRKPTPAALPTPEETPTPTPEKLKPALTFIVGLDRYSDSGRVSLNIYDGVIANCADRLAHAPAVEATIANDNLSRADAISKAKTEHDAYVVVLQLRPNTISGETGTYEDPNNVYIEYAVFAPGTGKLFTVGSAYPASHRRSIRLPTPGTSGGDYYLNQAAREAAERILDYFHKHPPSRP